MTTRRTAFDQTPGRGTGVRRVPFGFVALRAQYCVDDLSTVFHKRSALCRMGAAEKSTERYC